MSEYKSTSHMFEEFMKSTIWMDVEHELNKWLEDVRTMLEDVEGNLDLNGLKRLQGSADAIRNMLDLPTNVMGNIEDDINREREERENGKES